MKSGCPLAKSYGATVMCPVLNSRCFENIHIREDDDEALTLVAPSDFDAIWLNDNYVSDVEKALFSAAGREVKFRIVGPEDGEAPAAGTAAEGDSALFSPAVRAPVVPAAADDRARPPLIDSRYTFENFVVSPQNEMAFSAAMNVAMHPKETAFNPIFLFGPTGVGKTHLMHAIANKVFDDRRAKGLPPYKIVYVTCEAFTNDFLNTVLREKNQLEFHRRYREADVLLVDDADAGSVLSRVQRTDHAPRTGRAHERSSRQRHFRTRRSPRFPLSERAFRRHPAPDARDAPGHSAAKGGGSRL